MFVLWILSAWLENFLHSPCRYFSNTSALWKADSADFVAAQKQKHHSPFFVFVWEFKKRKEIHIHAPICAQCTARRPATVKSVYLNERKVGLSEFIVVFFLFFFFHTQR